MKTWIKATVKNCPGGMAHIEVTPTRFAGLYCGREDNLWTADAIELGESYVEFDGGGDYVYTNWTIDELGIG